MPLVSSRQSSRPQEFSSFQPFLYAVWIPMREIGRHIAPTCAVRSRASMSHAASFLDNHIARCLDDAANWKAVTEDRRSMTIRESSHTYSSRRGLGLGLHIRAVTGMRVGGFAGSSKLSTDDRVSAGSYGQ